MRTYLTLFFALTLFLLSAQTIKEGETYYNKGDYQKALSINSALLKKKPKDALLNYKVGMCLVQLKREAEGVKYLRKSVAGGFKKSFQILLPLYEKEYMYSEIVSLYDSLKIEQDSIYLRAVIGIDMMSRVEDVAIIDTVVVAKDSVLNFINISADLGTIKNSSALYKSPASVFGLMGYLTGKGDKMIFSNNNNGQADLFQSLKLLNGWSTPSLLSEQLATNADENYPFVLSDGITLYFSSKCEKSLGGYDIFVTRMNPTTNDYFQPQNIGMPFNSPYNDYLMVVDEILGEGYFVSDRYQNEDSVVVYHFVFNKEKAYLRDLPYEELIEFAQLKKWRKGEAKERTAFLVDGSSDGKAKKKGTFSFVVSDEVVYKSIDEFVNEEAKAKATVLMQYQEEYDTAKMKLDWYQNLLLDAGNDEDKKKYSVEIIKYEQVSFEKRNEIRKLTNEIRMLEQKEKE